MYVSYEFSSPNFDERPHESNVRYIILHYTDMIFEQALDSLRDPEFKVSSHYLIKEDGIIYQLVKDEMRAWHAGKSSWRGLEALNDCSIGIEIDNPGTTSFTDLQMNACIQLCESLVVKYNISKLNILGHSDIAPHRKIDPGIYFNWQLLASKSLGIYTSHKFSENVENNNDYEYTVDEIMSVQKRLAYIGYGIEITGKWDELTNSVIRAFQAHFYNEKILDKGIEFYRNMNSKYEWDDKSDKILNNIFNKVKKLYT